MKDNYDSIKKTARELVAKSELPRFYLEYSKETAYSSDFLENNPVISKLKKYIEKEIDNDFGHGLHHSIKVAIDAGALIIIYCNNADFTKEETDRVLLLAQCAGLLHDIKRKQKNHALKSADAAFEILQDYPLTQTEIDDICLAIKNHEAFKGIIGEFSIIGEVISDCLYDADKFRWGPDNFTHTVWEMVAFSKIPLSVFVTHFPRGMKAITKIKSTFRSETGKKYGPEFIEIGLSIGNELYKIISEQ